MKKIVIVLIVIISVLIVNVSAINPSGMLTHEKWFEISGGELMDLVIPEGIKSLGVFDLRYFCNNNIYLRSVLIPSTVTLIGRFNFALCINLKSIVIPDNVEVIEEYAFANCYGLKDVTLSKNLKQLREVFPRCYSLTQVVIPDGVEALSFTFTDCYNLTTVFIPASVKEMYEPFKGCNKLTIYAPAGSYAEEYAREFDIPFVAVDSWPPPVGEPLGHVLYSDVVAFINGDAIPTSNVYGRSMVAAEDLLYYGFDVVWDAESGTLNIGGYDANKPVVPIPVEKNTMPPGKFKQYYVYSEIKTYLSGEEIECYSINGRMLFDFELLAEYGSVTWNGVTSELHLDIE